MAILRYKKDGDSNKIREMPVISKMYTEYVISDTQYEDPNIELTPSVPTQTKGAGSYKGITAGVKFVPNSDSRNTYVSALTSQTYNLNSRYGADGFPEQITISAIPTISSVTYTPSSESIQANFSTGTGFPRQILINAIPSYYLNTKNNITAPPETTTISTPSGSITISKGYYDEDFIISANITNRGSIKNYLSIKPSTKDTVWETGYYLGDGTGSTASGKLNIQTGTLTLTANNTTYTPSTADGATWGDFFPTSITVQVPDSTPTPSTPPSDLVINSPSDTVTIPAGYYTNNITVTSNINNWGNPGTQSLTPNSKTSYIVNNGYYSSSFLISPATQSLTITNPTLAQNGSYYTKTYSYGSGTGSSTSWGNKYLTSFTIQVPTSVASNIVSGTSVCGISGTHVCAPSMTDNGTYSITSNGTHTIADSNSYYSKVSVNVPTSSMIDYGTYSITSNGTFKVVSQNLGYYYSSVQVDVQTTTSTVIASGSETPTGGTNASISWVIYADGTLVVGGSGAIPDYSSGWPPWYAYRSQVTAIIVQDGIYTIGIDAFRGYPNVQSINLSNKVHKINDRAFYDTAIDTASTSFLKITIPASVWSIGSQVFTVPLWEVRFLGNVPSGGVGTNAFTGDITQVKVPWSSSTKTITSMCTGTVGTQTYNYNVQTDNGSWI